MLDDRDAIVKLVDLQEHVLNTIKIVERDFRDHIEILLKLLLEKLSYERRVEPIFLL